MAEHKNSVYRQISEDISAKIESGVYPEGSMLEPERKLMEVYGVERTTIRRALEVLARDGKIIKKTGLGSIIAGKDCIPVDNTKRATEKNTKTVKTKTARKSLPSVILLKNDYSDGAKAIFENLTEKGHEKIMCVGKADEMFAALSGEAARLGLYDADLFVTVDERNTVDYIFERIWSGMRSSKPTAVVTANADVALKIMERAERMRISVPDELTVSALHTNRASGVCGCMFDGAAEEKRLLAMLEEVPDSVMQKITVSVKPVFTEGNTFAEAKSSRSGSGSMSAYLL